MLTNPDGSTSLVTKGNGYPSLVNIYEDRVVNSSAHRYDLSSQHLLGVVADVSQDSKTLTFKMCGSTIKHYYPDLNKTDSDCQNYTFNFDQPVIDFTTGVFGQATGYEIALFLLSDGTIEYMPIHQAIENNDVRSYGKLGDLSNIVRLESASAHGEAGCETNDTEGCVGGYTTVIAIDANGKIYNLNDYARPILEKTS